MARKRTATTGAAKSPRERLSSIEAVAKEFKSFRPAQEVLTRVRAVPTIFPQLDHATRVGGLPIERFMLLHGRSGEGKTFLTIGLLKSFLERGHFAVLIDAERTTPISWLESAMGEYAKHPWFFAQRPETYEDTVLKVRDFVNTLRRMREKKKVPEETSALIVVDSIRKLVPEGIFKKITQQSKPKPGEKEKVRDRSAQIKAAMNSAWLDELVPLLEQTRTAMIVIARETEDPEADIWDKRRGEDYKVGGGAALYYDASMVFRVERASYVREKGSGDAEDKSPKAVLGERHRVTIRKSKVAGGREDRQAVCYFHTSNGVLVPEGFDRARDVLDLGRQLGLLKTSGSWIMWRKNRWQGEHKAVTKLAANPELLAHLETEARAKFRDVKPIEVSSDGEVL